MVTAALGAIEHGNVCRRACSSEMRHYRPDFYGLPSDMAMPPCVCKAEFKKIEAGAIRLSIGTISYNFVGLSR